MIKSKVTLSKYAIVNLAVWASAVVFVGGGYLLLYQPQAIELAQVQKQYTESQSELEQARLAARDQTKEKMKQQYEETDRLISEFSTGQEKMTEVVFQIGQIANDLRLAEFSSKNEKKNDQSTVGKSETLDEGWFNVEFFATFNQFAEFINRLERHCPVVFVEEIGFRRGTSQSKGHAVSLRLSFLAEKEAEKKVAAVMN